MVGVPEADLAEWQSRRGKRQGQGGSSNGASGPASKRQKVENVALTPEQLKAQLEAHKALMSGKVPPAGMVAGQFHSPTPGPPPAMMGFPPGPPPGFGAAPPPMYNRPPPGFGPPPGMSPPAGPYAGPPPQFYPTGPPPNIAAPFRPPPIPAVPSISLPAVNPHQEAVKSGAKSRMVYNDATMSPEEKLASTSKYLYIDPDEARQAMATTSAPQLSLNAGSSSSPVPQYYGPPPGFSAPPPPPLGGSVSSPYAGSPLSSYSSTQQLPPQGHVPGPPASINYSSNPSQSHAQSYPSISSGGKGGIEPASRNAWENTAEALASANEAVGSGLQREADMGEMERKAKTDREQGVGRSPEAVGVTELASSQSTAGGQGGARPGRARAADLF